MEYDLALVGLSVCLLFFLSIVDSARLSLSEVSLRLLVTDSQFSSSVDFLRYILDNKQLFVLTISFGLQSTTIFLGILLVDISLRLGITFPLLLALVLAFIFSIVFRQLIPRLIVQNNPSWFLTKLLPFYYVYFRFAVIFTFPFYLLLKKFRYSSDLSIVPETQTSSTIGDDTIQALIDVGEEEGIIEESDSELIQSVIEFGDIIVKQIMTIRTEMVCIESSSTVREACNLMLEMRHSRLPVYKDQSDNIEGVVYIRDLLGCWSQDLPEEKLENITRPAYFVPENKSVSDLLKEMQKSKTQIAVVIDEFGGVAGLVTLEDILEEIVGEIEDEDVKESSPEEVEIIAEADGNYLIKGSTEIRKVELLFNLELSRDDFNTVNGLIINQLGRVPFIGESFSLQGLNFEVLEGDGRAIRKVRLSQQEVLTK